MRAAGRWLVVLVVLLLGRGRHERRRELESGRTLPVHVARTRAELLVVALLGATSLAALAFAVLYLVEPDTQLLGLALGLALAALAAALGVASKRLVPQERAVEPHPPVAEPEEAEGVARILEEAGSGISRGRLLKLAGVGAAGAVGGSLLLPFASLGPGLGHRLLDSQWRPSLLLVDDEGMPIRLDDLAVGTSLTAFPLGGDRRRLGSPLVVVRLDPAELELPDGRTGWDAEGIVAFSKICTHAGCAVSIFRYPTFEPTSERPALVCPCHYSTFDVRRGGDVVLGPAARALPQLPLGVDPEGRLVATGDFSGHVGPSYSGVSRS